MNRLRALVSQLTGGRGGGEAADADPSPPPALAAEVSTGNGAMTPQDLCLGGIWFGPFTEDEPDLASSPSADATIAAALEAGVRDYDTAPMYASGRCEQRLGHALRTADVPLSEIRIYTKSGRLLRDPSTNEPYLYEGPVPAPVTDNAYHEVDYSADGAAASLSDSLGRLGLESCHTLRVHGGWALLLPTEMYLAGRLAGFLSLSVCLLTADLCVDNLVA
jgi:aryl-alcohol dehydrogenase-like predicted oxidoreductase